MPPPTLPCFVPPPAQGMQTPHTGAKGREVTTGGSSCPITALIPPPLQSWAGSAGKGFPLT